MHYLPHLRKIITKKKKQKPTRVKPSEPLDFHTERSRASTTFSTVVHGEEATIPAVPFGNRFRPQVVGQRVAGPIPVHEELRRRDSDSSTCHAVCAVIVSVSVIVSICGTALILAWNTEVEKPVCDEACMEYTTRLHRTMDWSVAPCEDFYRFVCGRATNKTSVRLRLNGRFLHSVIDRARQEDVPAEGQTVSQRAARLFKTCDDVVTQDTDYVPRLRGYMRDANLHWPEHPETRDPGSVDVVSTMLHLNDKWNWPGLLRFSTERLTNSRFEVRVKPSRDLEKTKFISTQLGAGSPAYRSYFDTLYAHYGGGIQKGVTLEEMLDFEAQVLDPLLQLYFSTPQIYVFERNQWGPPGMWERWSSTIARHYQLAVSDVVTISTSHRDYFAMALHLIAEKEAIVELVIGWLCVQFTSWFANRQLIANHYGKVEDIVVHHRIVCLVFTMKFMGMAIFLPFVQSVYTEPVRNDTWRIARAVRRTVYQTLDRATYPWSNLDSAFHLLNIAVAHDIAARYSHYPDMEVSFIKNLRDTMQVLHQTDVEAIGVGLPVWALTDALFDIFNLYDRVDYMLKPSILTPPMYHLKAPAPVRLGAFGVDVAAATVLTYAELRHHGYSVGALDGYRDCIYAAVKQEQPGEDGREWHTKVLRSILYGAAMDVALSVLKQLMPSFDEERLYGVPLSGHQLFYVTQCYTHCGEEDGLALCNEPLRHKQDFANTFSCSRKSNMRSEYQCKTLF